MKHMTRDTFDPALVLEVLHKGGLDGFGESNLRGLLEEACHALHRERLHLHRIQTMTAALNQEVGN